LFSNWRHEPRTFVVRTKPAREITAAATIPSDGVSIFFPIRYVEISHARRREFVMRPLFPRYIFARFVESEKRYGRINRARGVERILADADGIPIPLPEAIVHDLRHRDRCDRAAAGEWKTGWQPGDKFKLLIGTYADITVTYVGEENGSVTVIVPFLGINHLIHVAIDAVPPSQQSVDAAAA
jgi:transcriptional antiterminator RfaH